MCVDKYFVSLIVEVGTLRNSLKIVQGILSAPEQLPARLGGRQFLGRLNFERSSGDCYVCEIRRDDLPKEVNNKLQFAAVVLVVLKQLGFDVWLPILLPGLTPEYAL